MPNAQAGTAPMGERVTTILSSQPPRLRVSPSERKRLVKKSATFATPNTSKVRGSESAIRDFTSLVCLPQDLVREYLDSPQSSVRPSSSQRTVRSRKGSFSPSASIMRAFVWSMISNFSSVGTSVSHPPIAIDMSI